MTFDEYRQYDALGLAGLVKQGEISAAELVETAIAQIEALNPALNAVIYYRFGEARSEALQTDRSAPFAGVPFLVKDLGMEVSGMPMCGGNRGYQNFVSTQDSFVVQKMKKAGLLILGKTNTPEFGLTPYTEPELFGPTRNPWNPAYTPGGSSGGSAAAVAAGIVPMASASDGGGSIRIPASCCGLFGLKPSRGRVSWSALKGEMCAGAVVENCLTRSVRDSAAYLDAIRGAAPGDPYIVESPERPYLEEVERSPGKLRIGYSAAHTLGFMVDNVCVEALNKAVEALRSEGHEVTEAELPYQKKDLTEAFLVVVAAELAGEMHILSQHLGRKVRPTDMEASTYAFYLLGRSFSAADYALAKRGWSEISRRIAVFHEKYDVLITPTLPKRPIPIGSLQPTTVEKRLINVVNTFGLGSAIKSAIDTQADKIYDYIPWTPFANLTGQPSMSMPFHWTPEENLPIGVMFTARLGEEDMLYRLAGQLERSGSAAFRPPR